VRELRMVRDKWKLSEAIKKLREAAAEGRNTVPAMIEATQAMATTGELLGTVREVFGYCYDPLNIVESPFH
jgi:methylmalonyl-CoA mutase N-terminal domain/subunit